MKLELLSLRAVNCGPLKDVVIDFSDGNGHARPVTLLAGANGSGKTTVLELIAALAEVLYSDATSDVSMLREDESFYFKPEGVLARTKFSCVTLLVNGAKFDVAFGEKPTDHKFSNEYFHIEPHHTGSRFNYRIFTSGIVWQQMRSKIVRQMVEGLTFAVKYSWDPKEPDMLPAVLYFQHYRGLTKLDATELVKVDDFYTWLYRYAPATNFRGSLESYLIWLEYSEPNTFNAVKDVVSALFPQKKSLAIERKRLKVVVDLQDGSRHDLDQLSSGEQNLLITLIELRRRLIPGSIVLFDEIENSLHPAFQHRMAQGLLRLQREVPFQLIVTSHADAFIDVFGTAATRVLPMPNYDSK